MKIQCSCGAKHIIEVTPEMAGQPVRFVCPSCGLDASEFVTNLVQQELARMNPAGAGHAPMGELLDDSEPAAPAPPPAKPAARVRVNMPAAAAAPAAQAPEEAQGVPCLKHPGEVAVQKCLMCGKPLCPKCMELFGYVCSPLCKAKAGSHGIDIPVYEGQRSVVEARFWRKAGRVGAAVGAAVALILGFWFWYAWFGCMPRPVFSFRFNDPSYSGQSEICGPSKDQIVFLHGGELARHDMKQKKQLWSRELIDKKQIAADVDKEIKSWQAYASRMAQEGESPGRAPDPERLTRRMERAAAAELTLHVRGENIWVAKADNLTRYDWNTGAPLKEFSIGAHAGGLISRGDEVVMLDISTRKPVVTRINLATGDGRTEELSGGATNLFAATDIGGGKSRETGGLPLGTPGKEMGKPMDPAKVAEQVQHLPYPARVALPALIGNTMSQERTLRELDDSGKPKPAQDEDDLASSLSLMPTEDGYVQFSVKLLESRIVERSAMKAAPAKSALDGPVSAGNSLEVAGEMLNEMQRERGGDKVREDMSRYQVKLRNPGTAQSWTGEVIGRPRFFPLKTVNVLTSSKLISVFDKQNRKLWERPLTYDVVGAAVLEDEKGASFGLGPCVEHKGSLYVFDEGVLTAFDLKTGNARWRMPSVGVAGIFFDNNDMMYVNTTTAGPEKIKYSRQIDIMNQDRGVVQKIDPADGRVLWSVETAAMINQVDGKFVFTIQHYAPRESDDEDGGFGLPQTGFEPKAYLRIRRLNPSSGRVVWEHYEPRGPLDVRIEGNTIRLVFKKEVSVLKFMSF